MPFHEFIDDDDSYSRPKDFYDSVNNFTFTVSQVNGTTRISPRQTEGLVELKIGLLMPFHQKDSDWTRRIAIGGTSAIRLAVAEINTQKLLPGAYVTLVEQDSYPHEGPIDQTVLVDAVRAAVSLIQQGVIGIIGDVSSSWTSLSASMSSNVQIPQCSFSSIATALSDKTQYKYFFRTIPTDLMYVDAVLKFATSQGWPKLGVLYSDDDYGQQMSESIIAKARKNNVRIREYVKIHVDDTTFDVHDAIDALMDKGNRIFFVAAAKEIQIAVLAVASKMGYMKNDTVWLAADVASDEMYNGVSLFNEILSQRTNSTSLPTIASTNSTDDSSNSTMSPIVYAAKAMNSTSPVLYNSTFTGGVFSFQSKSDLTGYPPYDTFMQKWLSLDPQIYPYAGTLNITGNEGMAYACMMVMAHGYNNIIRNSTNFHSNLELLASNRLKKYLGPSTFNMSFVGPNGPVTFDQNGDNTAANFDVLNIQKGIGVGIGNIMNGNLTLTSPPIFHDGTALVPAGVPSRRMLNPGYNSPASIAIMAISAFGTFVALVTIAIVVIYRKRDVFRVSSPLFCVLELVGFIFAYVSVYFFAGPRTKMTCAIIPITFHVGFALVLGNLIAKNYRIYRIFNNVYISGAVVRDYQLLKVSGSILLVVAVLLIAWFSSCEVEVAPAPVNRNSYYVECVYVGASTNVIQYMLVVFGTLLLLFATYLAFKTRSVGENYSKYSEYKQIGFSVYNIFFSALIGFIVFYTPATDYYARHYLTVAMITWSTTFSLLTLFLPKLYHFYFPHKVKNNGKSSDLTGREQSYAQNEISMDDMKHRESRSQSFGEILDMDRMLNQPIDIAPAPEEQQPTQLHRRHAATKSGDTIGAFVETHEARMPVQRVFKYFQFLSPWEMKRIILMPKIAYFSCFSEKDNNGFVFAYSKSSIVSARAGDYVLRIHGLGWYDVLLQVENQEEIEQWSSWFNYGKAATEPSIYPTLAASQSNLLSEAARHQTQNRSSRERIEHVNNDSGLTTHHLLLDTNRASCATMETMDSCIHQPILEIDDALTLSTSATTSVRQERSRETIDRFATIGSSVRRNHRSSFFSSFAAYLSPEEASPIAERATKEDIMLNEIEK